MERLTIKERGELLIKCNDGEYRSLCFGCESVKKCNPDEVKCGFFRAIEKLKEYEDLEEQGLLLKLPCKPGDKVYTIFMECPKNFKPEYCTDHDGSCEKCHHRVPVIMSGTFSLQHIHEIRKTIFLTQSEAEEALNRMEGEK